MKNISAPNFKRRKKKKIKSQNKRESLLLLRFSNTKYNRATFSSLENKNKIYLKSFNIYTQNKYKNLNQSKAKQSSQKKKNLNKNNEKPYKNAFAIIIISYILYVVIVSKNSPPALPPIQ